jgi:predicted permease
VVAQIAVSFVLLVAGSLLARSLSRAEHLDLGFRAEGVLNVQKDVAQLGYTQSQGQAFFDEVRRRVGRIQGVQDIAYAFSAPLGYVRLSGRLDTEDHPVGPGERPVSGRNIVSPRYFDTMDIALERGRTFAASDDEQSRPVAIVNRRLAEMLWPGRDPIGRRFSQTGPRGPWLEVVGVTGTGKYWSLFEDPRPFFYISFAQNYSPLRVLHVRTTLSPDALAPLVERAVSHLDPDLPLYDVQSMMKALDGSYGLFAVRTGAIFAVILAVVGLSLAVVGLYGIVSCVTTERTQEIGIRMALGAHPKKIAIMVIREAGTLALVGTFIGLLGAFAFARIMGGLLFGSALRHSIRRHSPSPLSAY